MSLPSPNVISHNDGIFIRTVKLILTKYFYESVQISLFFFFLSNVFFSVRIQSISAAFSLHDSMYKCWSLSFMALSVWKVPVNYFSQYPLICVCLKFCMIQLGVWILGENTTNLKCPLYCIKQGIYYINMRYCWWCLHWSLKAVCAKFCTEKLFFPCHIYLLEVRH